MAESIQRPGNRRTSRRVVAAIALVLLGLTQARPAAHDIPASVVVHMFARPEGTRLTVLVRLPLVSMRDFTFPTREGGAMLDLARLSLDTAGVQGRDAPETTGDSGGLLRDAARTWLIPGLAVFEGDRELGPPALRAARISLPSDRSFEAFDTALAHAIGEKLPVDTALPLTAAMLDIVLEYAIDSDQSRFAIDPQFARFGIRVVTSFRWVTPDGRERAFQFTGDPGLVRLDPRWHQAALTFVRAGFLHILDGIDHLLFLFCLVLPIRRFWQLVGVVTAFTAAHSITLCCAAFGLAPDALWFPPLVETLIALSIVYMALENIVVAAARTVPAGVAPVAAALRWRWMIAFAFGLVHGFGFSFALKETLQLAGRHLVTSLLSFNVGVEAGQVLVLMALVPLIALAFRFVVAERVGIIIASAIVAHTAWHWMADRAATLRGYDWSMSDPASMASLLRWLMAAVAAAGVVWLARRVLGRRV